MIYLEIGLMVILGIGLFFISRKNISVLKKLNKNKKSLQEVQNENKSLINENNILRNQYNKEKDNLSYIKKYIKKNK